MEQRSTTHQNFKDKTSYSRLAHQQEISMGSISDFTFGGKNSENEPNSKDSLISQQEFYDGNKETDEYFKSEEKLESKLPQANHPFKNGPQNFSGSLGSSTFSQPKKF